MIQAQSADGVLHQFPDGTPDAVVDQAMKGYATRHAPRSMAQEIGGAVSGAVDKLKTDVGAAYQASKDNTARLKGGKVSLADSVVNTFKDTGRTAGILLDAVNVPLSPLAGAIHGAIVKPYGKVMSGAFNAMGVPATSEDFEDSMNTALQAAGPAKGRLLTAPRPATRPVNAYANTAADAVSRFDRAGVSPMLATTGKGGATMANVVAENPVAGGIVRGRLRGAVDQTAASADNLANRYGETRGAQITGENVQSGVQRFARDKKAPTSFAAKAGAIYDDVFTKLDGAMAGKTDAPTVTSQRVAGAGMGADGQPISVLQRQSVGGSQIATPNTTTALNEITNGAQSRSISQLIADPTVSKAARSLESANSAKDMSFGDLRSLRTWVRTAQKNQELRQSIGDANLQRMEGALTQDIYHNAETLGSPDMVRQLRRADQFYAAGQGRIKDALSSFADAKSGESAYGRILQAAGSTSGADAQKLLSLKRSLAPDEWGDIASNVVSELGRPKAGNAHVGDFSVSEFVTNYNKLSPRGRAVLFDSVGGGGAKAGQLRQELDNLASVASDLKNVEKGANTSKTFVNGQAAATAAGLINPATTIPTAISLGGMALTGEAMTNPIVVRWVARTTGAARQGPRQLSIVRQQLERASKTNAALLPLYHQATLMLEGPKVATPVAASQTQPANQ